MVKAKLELKKRSACNVELLTKDRIKTFSEQERSRLIKISAEVGAQL